MPNPTAEDEDSAPRATHIQDFIFLRELSEVYLLLDHVSGRSDKSLSTEVFTAAWLQQICEIGWPPEGSPIQQAQQATTLLRAKDQLNSAAKPASGATIAFTLLVSGEDNPDQTTSHSMCARWARLLKCLRPARHDGSTHISTTAPHNHTTPTAPKSTATGWGTNPPSRRSLARLAYPGLVGVAQRFTWLIRAIIVLLLLWLVVTCSLSWDVAAGQAIFRRIDALHVLQGTLLKDIESAEAEATKQQTIDATTRSDASAKADIAARSEAPAKATPNLGIILLKDCDWPRALHPQPQGTVDDTGQFTRVNQVALCDSIARERADVAVSRENLADWLAPWGWLKGISHILCRGLCLSVSDGNLAVPADAPNEQWGAIVLESAGFPSWGPPDFLSWVPP